jgi:hypothetical protein
MTSFGELLAAGRTRSGRVRAATGLVLGALAVTTVAFLTSPTVFEGLDWGEMHRPNRHFMAESLRSGRLPLWNPHVALGRPFLADVETATLYPPNLLYVALDASSALALLTAAHLLLAGFGVLRLGRVLGADGWASAMAALSFGLGAPVAARLSAGQVAYAHAACYLPLIFALGLEVQESFCPSRLALLGGALGLQLLCGHPQIAWVTWVGLAAFLIGRAAGPPEGWRRRLTSGVAGLIAAVLLGLGVAAAMLGPFLELVTQGNRAHANLAFAGSASMEWWHWASLFVPNGRGRVFYWELNQYMGLLGAAAGLAGLMRLRDPNTRGLAAVAGVGVLVAAGPRTPLFPAIFHALPGLGAFRIHARAAILVSFALVMAGALLLSRPPRRRRLVELVGLGVALAGLAVLAARRFLPGSAPLPVAHLAVVVGAAILALLAACVAGPWRRAARLGLLVLVTVDLVTAHLAAKSAWAWPVPPTSVSERRLASKLAEAGLLGPGLAPPRVAVPRTVARENAAMVYGWASVTGYNALTLDRVWRYLHAAVGERPSPDENTYVSAGVFEHGPFAYREAAVVAGWDARAERVVLRPAGDPRAYVVGAVRLVRDWREAVALIAAGHDVHHTALVEPAGLAAIGTLGSGPPASAAASVVSFAPERVVIRAETDAPGLLVLKEAWYPGWEARVDGARAPCIPANAWMRAVPLSPGAHVVAFEYRSRFLWPGAAASLVSVSLLLLGPRLLRRRSRRPGSAPPRGVATEDGGQAA